MRKNTFVTVLILSVLVSGIFQNKSTYAEPITNSQNDEITIDSCPNANGCACTHTDDDGCLNSTSIPCHHKSAVKILPQITNNISSYGYDLFLTLLCGPLCGNWGAHVYAYGVANVGGILQW